MGGWLAILSLALVSFAIAAFTLRLPREGFAVFGAVLLFGLVGYAWQGSPQQPGSPKEPDIALDRESGEQMVEMRHQFFDANLPKADFIVRSDAYARRGKFSEASDFLRLGLRENPRNLEGWLALGMALVGHADGFVTPAAREAYDRASAVDPANPAAPLFLGFAYLGSGEIREARAVWGELLNNTPEDAPWRSDVERRVAALDQMIANAPMLQGR